MYGLRTASTSKHLPHKVILKLFNVQPSWKSNLTLNETIKIKAQVEWKPTSSFS